MANSKYDKRATIILFCGILSLLSCKNTPRNAHAISGAYSSNASDPDKAQFQGRGNCAYEVEGKVCVFPSALAELDFAGELACIHTKEYGWLFVKRDGTTIRTVDIDNGPDNGHEVVPMLYSAEEIPAELNQLVHD